MSAVKYYLADVEIRDGEFEHSTTLRFETSGDPTEYHEKVVSTFYNEDGAEKDENGHYWQDYVVYFAGVITEIDEYTYKGIESHVGVWSLEDE